MLKRYSNRKWNCSIPISATFIYQRQTIQDLQFLLVWSPSSLNITLDYRCTTSTEQGKKGGWELKRKVYLVGN